MYIKKILSELAKNIILFTYNFYHCLKSTFSNVNPEIVLVHNLGNQYLAYIEAGNGDWMFWRVMVLYKNQQLLTCHFLDLGKQVILDLDKTFLVPMPGSQSWISLIDQVSHLVMFTK